MWEYRHEGHHCQWTGLHKPSCLQVSVQTEKQGLFLESWNRDLFKAAGHVVPLMSRSFQCHFPQIKEDK